MINYERHWVFFFWQHTSQRSAGSSILKCDLQLCFVIYRSERGVFGPSLFDRREQDFVLCERFQWKKKNHPLDCKPVVNKNNQLIDESEIMMASHCHRLLFFNKLTASTKRFPNALEKIHSVFSSSSSSSFATVAAAGLHRYKRDSFGPKNLRAWLMNKAFRQSPWLHHMITFTYGNSCIISSIKQIQMTPKKIKRKALCSHQKRDNYRSSSANSKTSRLPQIHSGCGDKALHLCTFGPYCFASNCTVFSMSAIKHSLICIFLGFRRKKKIKKTNAIGCRPESQSKKKKNFGGWCFFFLGVNIGGDPTQEERVLEIVWLVWRHQSAACLKKGTSCTVQRVVGTV